MVPVELIAAIAVGHPPFRKLKTSYQYAIAAMLWRWSTVRYRHVKYPDSLFLSKDDVKGLWGHFDTMTRHMGSDYFRVIAKDYENHQTNAYRPFDFLIEILIRFLAERRTVRFLDKVGNPLKVPTNPIKSLAAPDKNTGKVKKSVWAGVRCATKIAVDVYSLEFLAESASDPFLRLEAFRLIQMSQNVDSPGFIPLQYEQKSTGRIVEIRSNFQNTPREVLGFALMDRWDYDVENAHFSILAQWATRLGKLTPCIDNYLKNKKQLRDDLAKHCDAPVHAIKEGLIAIIYGVEFTSYAKYTRLGSVFGEASYQKFIGHPEVARLYKEVGTLRQLIVNDMPRRAGGFGNGMGIYVQASNSSGDLKRLLCHALQGAEALALKTILTHYGEHILLAMHDGWVSDVQLPIQAMEEKIEEALGFALRIEECRLPKVGLNLTIQDETYNFSDKSQINQSFTEILREYLVSNRAPAVGGLTDSVLRANWNRPEIVRELIAQRKLQRLS